MTSVLFFCQFHFNGFFKFMLYFFIFFRRLYFSYPNIYYRAEKDCFSYKGNHPISAAEGKGADFKKGEKQSPRFSQSTRSIR